MSLWIRRKWPKSCKCSRVTKFRNFISAKFKAYLGSEIIILGKFSLLLMGQSDREHSLWERITLWLVSGRTLVLLLIHGSNLSGHTASKYASSIWTYTNSTSKTFYSTLPLASNKTNPIRSVILTIGNYFHGIDKIQKSIQVSLKFRLTKLHVCHPSGLTKNCAHI